MELSSHPRTVEIYFLLRVIQERVESRHISTVNEVFKNPTLIHVINGGKSSNQLHPEFTGELVHVHAPVSECSGNIPISAPAKFFQPLPTPFSIRHPLRCILELTPPACQFPRLFFARCPIDSESQISFLRHLQLILPVDQGHRTIRVGLQPIVGTVDSAVSLSSNYEPR